MLLLDSRATEDINIKNQLTPPRNPILSRKDNSEQPMDRSSSTLVTLGILIGVIAGLAVGYRAFSPDKPSNYAECLLIYGKQNGISSGVYSACSTLFPGPGLVNEFNPRIPNPAARPR